jgi:hypothetical protein
MTDHISLISPSLADFLDRLGLPPGARDRVEEIDRKLSEELQSDNPDVDGCASLAIEAADIVLDVGEARAAVEAFDFDRIDWGDDDSAADAKRRGRHV